MQKLGKIASIWKDLIGNGTITNALTAILLYVRKVRLKEETKVKKNTITKQNITNH
jgi:hypothetical protein